MAEGYWMTPSEDQVFDVCWDCLVRNPFIALLTLCQFHDGRKVRVYWDTTANCLEIYGSSSFVRPPPVVKTFEGRFVLCRRYFNCVKGNSCTFAHNVREMLLWNESLGRFPTQQPRRKQSRDQKKNVIVQSDVEAAKKLLSVKTYKDKFQSLINLEEKAHVEELLKRCDGNYEFILESKGERLGWLPPNAERWNHKCYGYLTGLNGDQISYAGQASRKITMHFDKCQVVGDVLAINNSHVEEKLYIGFKDEVQQRLSSCVCKAEFKLNFSYFERLHDSVKHLRPDVIKRIIPDASKFSLETPPDTSLEHCSDILNLKECSEDQINALRTIISRESNDPPVLVSGPFGSGKTRVLALTSRYYFHCTDSVVRILVCTQQHVSADAFYECFDNLFAEKDKDLEVIRLVPSHSYRNSDIKCYKEMEYIQEARVLARRKLLIITTCSTAITMYTKKAIEVGFFTHILLDEGAQMREPEAVAPLNFATEDTKIVIAGDHKQIGPAMLVLGDIPQNHGLAVSLMERLYKTYTVDLQDSAQHYHTALVSNFRCCSTITNFCGKLFYHTPLKSKVRTFETYPCFKFICSEVNFVENPADSKTVNVKEAEIATEEVKRLFLNWRSHHEWGAKDCSQICLTSPTRSQMTSIKKLMKDYKPAVQEARKVPIYDIQGKEYTAVIISTYEPINEDASTRNLTKSISDPFVFNTVLSRAKYMVIAIGNPFNLLQKEEHMVEKYGEAGKCWSTFMKACMDENTFIFHSSIPERVHSRSMLMLKALLSKPLQHCESTNNSDQMRPDESDPESLPAEKDTVMSPLQDLTQFDRMFVSKQYIGEGGFGVVFNVRKELDQKNYAVKVIKMPTSERDKKHVNRVNREIRTLAHLSHPNIVRYFHSWIDRVPVETGREEVLKMLEKESYSFAPEPSSDENVQTPENISPDESGSIIFVNEAPEKEMVMSDATETNEVLEDKKCLFIQMELCREYTLKNWFSKHPLKRKKFTVINYMKQILNAVVYIHENNKIHRDLKPANIFFALDSESIVKVGDFGLVTDHDGSRSGSGSGPNAVKRDAALALTEGVGTRMYNSPEQLAGEDYGPKVDMYAMGLIFMELFYPYMESIHERQKLFTEVRRTEKIPESVKRNFKSEASLIEQLLVKDPQGRLSAKKCRDSFEELLQNLNISESSSEYYDLSKIN